MHSGEGLKAKTGTVATRYGTAAEISIWLFACLSKLNSLHDSCRFKELYTSVSSEEALSIPTLLQALQAQGKLSRKALSLAADNH